MRYKSVKDCSIHVHECISFPVICVCVLSHFSCHPMDCSPPASPVHGIFQARILEWVAISFSRGSSRPRDQTRISYISRTGNGFFTTSATLSPDLTSDHKHDPVIMLAHSTSWSQTLYSLNLVGGYTRNPIAEKR